MIVGAGAAGLSAAWHARRLGLSPLVLERAETVGGAWRLMPQGLRCLSPRQHDVMPDGDFPDAPEERAHRSAVVALLERFQRRHKFRVQPSVSATSLRTRGDALVLETSRGPITTRSLVVATGEFGRPYTPTLTGVFGGTSVHYRDFRAAELRPGERVLIVGAGNSGAEAAVAALQAGAEVSVATPDPLTRPNPAPPWAREALYRLSAVPLRWVPGDGGCSERTPVVDPELFDAVTAGRVTQVSRLVSLEPAGAVDATGRRVAADRIVWCTGFRREVDFTAPLLGAPRHRGGLSLGHRGVGYLGLPCQRTRRSGFLRGFAEDAGAVVRGLAGRVT